MLLFQYLKTQDNAFGDCRNVTLQHRSRNVYYYQCGMHAVCCDSIWTFNDHIFHVYRHNKKLAY